jgi:hypothetical protein
MAGLGKGPMGCCDRYDECQTIGKCTNPAARQITRCAIQDRVLETPFPLLYALKQKGLVEILTNHLTQKGFRYLGEVALDSTGRIKMTDAHILLWSILTLSVLVDSRLSPKDLRGVFKKLKQMIDLVTKV